MFFFLLFSLLACDSATDSAETPTLPGDVYECPRAGQLEVNVDPGWPMAAQCSPTSCLPIVSWTLTDVLILGCTPGYQVVVNWR